MGILPPGDYIGYCVRMENKTAKSGRPYTQVELSHKGRKLFMSLAVSQYTPVYLVELLAKSLVFGWPLVITVVIESTPNFGDCLRVKRVKEYTGGIGNG